MNKRSVTFDFSIRSKVAILIGLALVFYMAGSGPDHEPITWATGGGLIGFIIADFFHVTCPPTKPRL